MENYKMIKYSNGNVTLDIRFSKEENTVYMSQSEMAILFSKTRKTITWYISNLKRICAENAQIGWKYQPIGYSQEPIKIDGKPIKFSYID